MSQETDPGNDRSCFREARRNEGTVVLITDKQDRAAFLLGKLRRLLEGNSQ